MPEPGIDQTVLAFDFGIKRVGVAVGESRLGSGRPLLTISHEANDARFAAIAKLIAEWRPGRLVVGRPLNDDGSAHDMTARCERFAQQLAGRFRLPVSLVDERFSSLAADDALRARGQTDWRARKQGLDAESARVILDCWFAQPTVSNPVNG
ncbi:MAG: Holliday junction resolvase RuvX [Rhodocyclaceae bacterium]|nr:Holliday junction resolvase RuvX [Rhodocyclaceae bacterium]MBK6908808.1 Holliday junction resolvase RuvX [Rhodocyclaceae bacterium]